MFPVGIKVVLQDHPASTLVNMSVPLLARLVNEIPSIACVKLESLPTPPKIAALKGGMMREDCTILTGTPISLHFPSTFTPLSLSFTLISLELQVWVRSTVRTTSRPAATVS